MNHIRPLICSFLAAFFFAGCAGSKDFEDAKDLKAQYELFFDMSPAADVAQIRARRVWVGDTLSDWIAFTCTSATFTKIVEHVQPKAFTKAQIDAGTDQDLPDLDHVNPTAPKWWPAAPVGRITRVFVLDRPYDRKASEADKLVFWRDEASNTVFAYYVAWR